MNFDEIENLSEEQINELYEDLIAGHCFLKNGSRWQYYDSCSGLECTQGGNSLYTCMTNCERKGLTYGATYCYCTAKPDADEIGDDAGNVVICR